MQFLNFVSIAWYGFCFHLAFLEIFQEGKMVYFACQSQESKPNSSDEEEIGFGIRIKYQWFLLCLSIEAYFFVIP